MTQTTPALRPLNDAMSQADRVATAPAPRKVGVDERTRDQLLAYAPRYGSLINFFNLGDSPDGTWAEFFASDSTIDGAVRSSIDIDEIERRARELLDELRSGLAYEQRMEAFDALLALTARLLPTGSERSQQSVGHLRRHARHAHRHERRERWFEEAIEILEALTIALLEDLKQHDDASASALTPPGDAHTPPIALYLAFVDLFIQARARLNTFPRRLVDFYYGTLLKQRTLAAQPDHVYLAFTTAPNVEKAAIAKGTPFLAGTDEQNNPITYAADVALEVQAASVKKIGVHRVVYDEDPSSPTYGNIIKILSASQLVDNGDVLDPTPHLQPANLGFVMESSVLLLAGGERTITLTFDLSYQGAPTGAAAADQSDVYSYLGTLLQSAFALYYSKADGWEQVASYSATVTPLDQAGAVSVVISFTLPSDAPAVQTIVSAPAGTSLPSPGQPAVASILQQAVLSKFTPAAALGMSALEMLSKINLDNLEISVSVTGLSELTLKTPQGTVDPKAHAAIFGSAPAQYDALEIHAPELFTKPLSTLSVAITWAGLPVTADGFAGYYKGYVVDADGNSDPQSPLFDNTSFEVALSVANPGLWNITGTEPIYLFQTDAKGDTDPAAPPLQTSILTASGVLASAAPAYYDPSASALEVVLTNPPYAFGAILYANNVMAATTAQVAAISASSAANAASSTTADVAKAADVNTSAPDKSYRSAVTAALNRAISSLIGKALASIHAAIAHSALPAQSQQEYLASLQAAFQKPPEPQGSWLRRLLAKIFRRNADAQSMLTNLESWIAEHKADLGAIASPLVERAQTILDAAQALANSLAVVKTSPPITARPRVDAAIQQALAMLRPHSAAVASSSSGASTQPALVLPNPPWAPMAAAVTVSYTSSAVVNFAAAPNSVARAASAAAAAPASLLHLTPFDLVGAPAASGTATPLLAQVDPQSALYVELTELVSTLTLLLVLTVDDGRWSSEVPSVVWEQKVATQWQPILLLGDTTNGLANSGIVTLGLSTDPAATTTVRVRVDSGTNNVPNVQQVFANALGATWVPPNGAALLGIPKRPYTIKESQTTLVGIGSIVQPMQSLGGCPPVVGSAFDGWMSERLRHKGYGITSWDYARLVLAAVPSLWQVAVVPVVDESTGAPASGNVWVIAVAGITTPNIADPTAPLVDSTVLTEVGELLSGIISPFVQLRVTNPPYVRLKVSATVTFSPENTPDFWESHLNNELCSWLSPWPDPKLGPRPANYYTRHAIAEFVRHRPYVAGVVKLDVSVDPASTVSGYAYFTSALEHDVSSKTTARAASSLLVYRT